jgi:hypothetical protein
VKNLEIRRALCCQVDQLLCSAAVYFTEPGLISWTSYLIGRNYSLKERAWWSVTFIPTMQKVDMGELRFKANPDKKKVIETLC